MSRGRAGLGATPRSVGPDAHAHWLGHVPWLGSQIAARDGAGERRPHWTGESPSPGDGWAAPTGVVVVHRAPRSAYDTQAAGKEAKHRAHLCSRCQPPLRGLGGVGRLAFRPRATPHPTTSAQGLGALSVGVVERRGGCLAMGTCPQRCRCRHMSCRYLVNSTWVAASLLLWLASLREPVHASCGLRLRCRTHVSSMLDLSRALCMSALLFPTSSQRSVARHRCKLHELATSSMGGCLCLVARGMSGGWPIGGSLFGSSSLGKGHLRKDVRTLPRHLACCAQACRRRWLQWKKASRTAAMRSLALRSQVSAAFLPPLTNVVNLHLRNPWLCELALWL